MMSRAADPIRISWKDSLATRISLTTIILVVIAILLVGSFLIWIAFQTEQQSAFQIQQKNADTVSILISGFIENVRSQILVFEESTGFDTLSSTEQHEALRDLLIRHKTTFSQFTVFDTLGNEVVKVSRYHSFLPDELQNMSSDPAYVAVMDGNRYVSPIYISPDSGLLSMNIGVPLKNYRGQTVGVLVSEVNCIELWQEVSGQNAGSIGYAYIVDKNGRLIAYQDISEVLNRYNEDMGSLPPVSAFAAGTNNPLHTYLYRGFFGDLVVGAFAPINGTDWAVIAENPEENAFAGVREMEFSLITLMLSCIVIAGGVGYFMSRRYTDPLEDLTRIAQKLKSGEWETEITHTGRSDEVGVLSRSFTQMRDELRVLYTNLERQLADLSRMQAEILLSEEQYRTIFENSGNALLLIEDDMTISLINHEMELLWGYSKAEVENRMKWTSFIAHEDELSRMTEYHQKRRFSPSSVPLSYEFSFRTKDGDIRDVITTVTMIPGTTRSLAAIINITDKKQVEYALIQARKKLSLLNTLTFNDIRSNVYVLAGYIDLKSESIGNTEIQTWIERERQSIKNINAALAFAKDYQDMGLKPAGWQNVEQVFLYAISHLDLSFLSRKLDLSGLEIYADPLLERVFYILASNVVTHGGMVTAFSVYAIRSANEVIIYFEDNGSGIPDAEKETIFDEYSREKKGISLFFAREILGITNIVIRETGSAGTGARFEIEVPRGRFRYSDATVSES